ncbi:N(5)-(carboxyethyl)ornithine synthase [Candidatus Enterococcus ferrettii]|uniref:Alanine dehydrogenase n=1 Tax=Candidatus Enterococcus ferrettii TaxID=2815324 RepID=A0ABV0EXU0_9ENTE|nr:N(5)-(carboxyethyl)ornithine synthase [Enterococcus sp. 665A]MBO1343155.1 N(5)-(carboxyethyl)ornithine synthase [Enterococcus sp. 665A]
MSKRTMGFVIGHKPNEKRRALLPSDIQDIQNKQQLIFETGYGEHLGIEDAAYEQLDCRVLQRDQVLQQDIICDPKIGEADYLDSLKKGQVLFGWIHTSSNQTSLEPLYRRGVEMIAWERMYQDNRHSFWENNQIAGEAAIMHAYLLYGKLPEETKAAVIGRGNVAQGAIRILEKLGAEVVIYNRQQEKLLQKELGNFTVVVNAVKWDKKRQDHILSRADLKKLPPHSLIIDISSDTHGAIETCRPSADDSLYEVDSILHYTINNTPSIFFQTATSAISKEVAKYVDNLIENRRNPVLEGARIKPAES